MIKYFSFSFSLSQLDNQMIKQYSNQMKYVRVRFRNQTKEKRKEKNMSRKIFVN